MSSTRFLHRHSLHNTAFWIIVIGFTLITYGCKIEKEIYHTNIILINIDDLGWKDVGFMGSEYYETPHIDHLASKGMIFNQAYAAAANCAPSRASMMTGLWPTRHGIYTVGNSERGAAEHRRLIPVKNTTTLPDSFLTIPEYLLQKGYATCHSGKWHLSDDPGDYGFQVNIGGGHNGHPRSYYPPYKNVSLEGENNEHLTDLITKKTTTFIDTVSQPFFLNFSLYSVHTPIQPIDSLLPKYKSKSPSQGQNNPAYATMIENMDKNIGIIMSSLEERALLDNTLIIFTSDNGGLYGITEQPPLRAGKGSYYEGGIRISFALIWPGKVKENTTSDIPITHLDIFPTILELFDENQNLDGNSLLGLISDTEVTQGRSLYWHFPVYLQAYNKSYNENRDSLFRTRPGSVVRQGNWKLHYYFEDEGVELYNLSDDIGERNNLSKRNEARVDMLLNDLQSWWKETNAPTIMEKNPAFNE
ncbi:MAG: sulfatase [Saprospiraceae bacterium]|nr:sulfatase [Saprospiraceae bacterium]